MPVGMHRRSLFQPPEKHPTLLSDDPPAPQLEETPGTRSSVVAGVVGAGIHRPKKRPVQFRQRRPLQPSRPPKTAHADRCLHGAERRHAGARVCHPAPCALGRDHPTVERHVMRNDGAALCSRLPERFKRRPERYAGGDRSIGGDAVYPHGIRRYREPVRANDETLTPVGLPVIIAEEPRDLHQSPPA